MTQQSAANSEESASAAEELNSQAEELQSMVSEFKLSTNGGGARREATQTAHVFREEAASAGKQSG
ncbi:MAG: hypothetical protein GTN78_00835, partial [Gemmatimonadales bacterium]|nr:hypothetical protein [Gemmatimonadales bacterium]